MAADHRAVEEQHRHVVAMAPFEDWITVHIHHFDRGQRHRPPELPQLREHLLAEVAVAPMDHGENGRLFQRGGGECANGPPGSGAREGGGGTESVAFSALTESAMKRTVCGGTSPTAVTL